MLAGLLQQFSGVVGPLPHKAYTVWERVTWTLTVVCAIKLPGRQLGREGPPFAREVWEGCAKKGILAGRRLPALHRVPSRESSMD